MILSFSEDKLTKAPRFGGSSVEAGVGGLSTVPASCTFQRITCSYWFFCEENQRTTPRASFLSEPWHIKKIIVYNIQSTEELYRRTIH